VKGWIYWRRRYWGIKVAIVSDTLRAIQKLVALEKVRASEHGDEELLEDDISIDELLSGIQIAIVVEDYPDAFKGPSVLVLQKYKGRAVHVLWGLARNAPDVATLITAYFPDPKRWYDDFLKRKPK
jgi:Domain of unknown function (DUF4258)